MTLAWFVIWIIANLAGGSEPLELDPVNGWTATLVLAPLSTSTGLGPSLGVGRREFPRRGMIRQARDLPQVAAG